MPKKEKENELQIVYGKLEDQKKARETKVEGTISEIRIGKIRDFVKSENLDKFNNPDSDCVNLTIDTPDQYPVNKLMTISSHPNSNMQRYHHKYEVYPEVGGVYPLEFQGGFWRPAQL